MKSYYFFILYCDMLSFQCLQVILQGVLESLILVDRLIFLKECELHAEIIPVMDDFISPRNIAIVAWKS